MGINDHMQYLWDFGDGNFSSESSPTHKYYIPGTYTVKLTITYSDGSTYTITYVDYVTVSDFTYGNEYDVSFTDTCYRSAVNVSQGIKTTKYTGGNWVYPTAYTGTCKGMTENGETVSLVCDNRNGRIYRVGVPEIWTDRTSSYDAYEIPAKIRLKERTARAGEYHEIEHVESHIHIRPWKESYRDATGYTSEGFRDNHSIDLQLYENGEPTTPSTKLEDLSRYGDYVCRKRVEARRIQEEYLFDTAAWRIVKTQEKYMPIDKAAGPAYDYPSEQVWQDAFRGQLLWLSRDRLRPTYNRATGTIMTGDYDQLTVGPDNQSKSAMAMTSLHSLSDTVDSIDSDFTLSFWVGSMAVFPGTIFQCSADSGTLTIQINEIGGVRYVIFNDGVNGWSRTLDWSSGWVYIVVQRTGDNLKIYEDGSSIFSNEMIDSSISYGGDVIVSSGCILSIFDVRLLESAVASGAIGYYYDQVINNGKQCPFLPIIR